MTSYAVKVDNMTVMLPSRNGDEVWRAVVYCTGSWVAPEVGLDGFREEKILKTALVWAITQRVVVMTLVS
jgi:hypothetical protein